MSRRGGAAVRIRDLVPADLEVVLALNRAAEPAVGPLDVAGLTALVELASHARVATADGTVVGALVGLLPGRGYASPHYRWFEASGVAFYYVDRIVVAAHARAGGLGRALYADAIATARALGMPRVVCEVNEVPPNPASMAFHTALGFTRLAAQSDPRDGKTVRMMELPLR